MRSISLIVAIALLVAAPLAAARDPLQTEVAAPQAGPKDYSRNSVTGEYAPAKDAATLSQRIQDLRWLAARDGGIRTSSLAGTTSADATPRAAAPTGDDDSWTAIAVGFAGGCLVAGAAAVLAGRARRTRIAA
jgi:hypothetical protein